MTLPRLLLLAVLISLPASAHIHGGRYKLGLDSKLQEVGRFGFGNNGQARVTVVKGVFDVENAGFFLSKVELRSLDAGCTLNGEALQGNFSYTIFMKPTDAKGNYLESGSHAGSEAGSEAGTQKRMLRELEDTGSAAKDETPAPTPASDVPAMWRGEISVSEAGFWYLYYYNCKSNRKHIEIKISICNLDSSSDCNYLQIGDQMLPLMYLLFAFAFFAALVIWVRVLKRNKEYVVKIHKLMAICLGLYCGTCFFEWLRYYHFAAYGNTTDFYDSLYFIFLILKGLLVFGGIVLLGTGWSMFKEFLSGREKKLLVVVIPLQLVVNVCYIVLEETRESDPTWWSYAKALMIIDFICCFLVIFPVIWATNSLRQAATVDGKAALNIKRYKKFNALYCCMFVWVYFTRIILFFGKNLFSDYRNTWIGPFLKESSTLIFFIYAGYVFRPRKENPYTNLDERDFEDVGEALQMELEEREKDKRDLEQGNQPYVVNGGALQGSVTI